MLEEKLTKDITWAYTAKKIAPYLKVTCPKIPFLQRIKLTLFYSVLNGMLKIRFYYSGEKKQIDKFIEDRIKAEEEYLIKAGINTPEERDALTIVNAAGLYLQSVINHAEDYKNDEFSLLEITKEEIKVNKKNFEDIIDLAISDGIFEIEEQTPFKIKGKRKQLKTVNPDFKEKAKEKLLEEIYLALDNGAKVNLLERVTLEKDEDMFYMGILGSL